MIKKILLLCTIGLLFSGCGAQTTNTETGDKTPDQLTKNTAFALGLHVGDFTISNRERSGVKITYLATTKTGQEYNCYVTSTIVMSDAMCNKVGEPAKNPFTGK